MTSRRARSSSRSRSRRLYAGKSIENEKQYEGEEEGDVEGARGEDRELAGRVEPRRQESGLEELQLSGRPASRGPSLYPPHVSKSPSLPWRTGASRCGRRSSPPRSSTTRLGPSIRRSCSTTWSRSRGSSPARGCSRSAARPGRRRRCSSSAASRSPASSSSTIWRSAPAGTSPDSRSRSRSRRSRPGTAGPAASTSSSPRRRGTGSIRRCATRGAPAAASERPPRVWSAAHAFPDGFDPFFTEIQDVYDEIGEATRANGRRRGPRRRGRRARGRSERAFRGRARTALRLGTAVHG